MWPLLAVCLEALEMKTARPGSLFLHSNPAEMKTRAEALHVKIKAEALHVKIHIFFLTS